MSHDLAASLAALAAQFPGTLGVAIRYLPDGPEVTFNADGLFPTASVIKVPILVEVFAQAAAGILDLHGRIPLGDRDKIEGSGVLQYLQPGLMPTVRDLAELMIIVSDNTATGMLIDAVGVDAVNGRMRGLGFTQTTLGRTDAATPPSPGNDRGATIGHSVTTPARDVPPVRAALARGV